MKRLLILVAILSFGMMLTSDDQVATNFFGREIWATYCPYINGPCVIPPA